MLSQKVTVEHVEPFRHRLHAMQVESIKEALVEWCVELSPRKRAERGCRLDQWPCAYRPRWRLRYLKQQVPGAELAVMREDVPSMKSGDKGDFKYVDDLVYPGVKVDRELRDGDTVKLGNVLLTAYHTPGHTRGATTWVANVVENSKTYVVAFPDGAGFNPGYRLMKNPSYPGIADNYRRTHHKLEMLKPDIWLAQHNEYYDLEGKRARAGTEGVNAWIDPEGYRRWVASKKRAFEDQVDKEMDDRSSAR